MRKILVSALITLPVLASAAEAPKVKLGGRIDTMAAVVHQNKNYRTTNPSGSGNQLHKTAIVNDTALDVNVDGVSSHGFKYGGHIRLHADTSNATNGETSHGDKTMFYVQSDKIGRFEAGNTPGAGGLFEMELTFFNRGTYGVDGYWSQLVSDKTVRTSKLTSSFNTRGFEFIVSPNLFSNYSGNHYSDAPKANFFTKPVKNLTLGITYIPDMDSTGTVTGRASKTGSPVFDSQRSNNPASFRRIVSGGGVLDIDPSKDIKIRASLAGEIGKAKNNKMRDLRAYEAGVTLTLHEKYKVAGSYGNWSKSGTLKNPSAGALQKAYYWTAGLGYSEGNFGTALTYMESRKAGGIEALTTKQSSIPLANVSDFKTNKFNNIVLDVDYKLAPGFLPYVGVSKFRFKESAGSVDHGFVVMGGTRLLF